MHHIPQDFCDALHRTFNGRLRIRWSIARGEYHIEQQVGRAALPPWRISEVDDQLIRARDGYHFVMAVKAGTDVPCRVCGFRCKVPVLKSAEIVCTRCIDNKHRGKEYGGFWPLSDSLIDHLRSIDPNRDGHKIAKAAQDRTLEQREVNFKRGLHNHIEAATLDDKYQLFDTPFSGYTGKESPKASINGNRY